MTRSAALLDAAMTVQRWQRQQRKRRYTGYTANRIRNHVAGALGCYPAWDSIEAAIVLRLLTEHKPVRRRKAA